MRASREYFRNYYRKRKQQYINMLGGKCSICGTTEQLQFHHVNRNTKDLAISRLMNFSKEIVEKELNKCILLCKRCHTNVHKNDGTWISCGGSHVGSIGANNPKARKVLCIETNKQYNCISDCAKDMGFHPYRHKIYAVCRGQRKAYKGYHFKYI